MYYDNYTREDIEALREQVFAILKETAEKEGRLVFEMDLLKLFLFYTYSDFKTKSVDFLIMYGDITNEILRRIDLSELSWENVSVCFQDFTGTNAKIDPQLVYNKNMNYGKYPLDFTGKSFNKVSVIGIDLNGATNVDLNPQTVANKNMSDGKLPVDFTNKSFKNVIVVGIDLNDATNVNLDPQTIYDKNMSYGKFPLDFTGKSFEDVNIIETDFANAILDENYAKSNKIESFVRIRN